MGKMAPRDRGPRSSPGGGGAPAGRAPPGQESCCRWLSPGVRAYLQEGSGLLTRPWEGEPLGEGHGGALQSKGGGRGAESWGQFPRSVGP